MAFGKKNKAPDPVTPEEVADLGFKHEVSAAKDKNSSVYEHFHSQENAKAVADAKKRKKRYAIILASMLGVLVFAYIVSMLMTQMGDLTITVGDLYDGKTIMLCENADFEDGVTVKLNGGAVKDVTNITKDWLPAGLDDEKDGEHSGDNYLAYTFYLKNTGDRDLEYNTTFRLTGAAKSADEAVRFQIYRNGADQVFAKASYNDRSKAEEDATAFVDDNTIYTAQSTPLAAGATDKYTVVVWIEGNDPECVDAIRGGHVKSNMVFDVVPEKKG